MRVFLGGEGATELGDWAHEPSWRADDPSAVLPGVLEAFLRRVSAKGWKVVDAVQWKNIRKYRAGRHDAAEVRNVRGLALLAEEAGCDVLAFTRDRDRDSAREKAIEEGIEQAQEAHDLAIVGGVAIEAIEAWILAALGHRGSERHARPKSMLPAELSREEGIQAIEDSDIDRLPADASSLRKWLDRAQVALAADTE